MVSTPDPEGRKFLTKAKQLDTTIGTFYLTYFLLDTEHHKDVVHVDLSMKDRQWVVRYSLACGLLMHRIHKHSPVRDGEEAHQPNVPHEIKTLIKTQLQELERHVAIRGVKDS